VELEASAGGAFRPAAAQETVPPVSAAEIADILANTTPHHAAILSTIKRLIDIVGALVGLSVCSVVYLLCARTIRRQSGASVIFRQRRVGEGGRTFELFKLRTMRADAEKRLQKLQHRNEMRGPVFKIRNDPRIIPIGRWLRRYHLDELPQFWNVLTGEMSLVGARPPTPLEVERYSHRHYLRLRMKPGLTGLWQLYGNAAVNDFEEIVTLDCRYIDKWSLWLDFKILIKTLPKILRGTGC
jgi:lipopolysaccharide/colanic/teichoic acid biosynthesis glycosyltransferase